MENNNKLTIEELHLIAKALGTLSATDNEAHEKSADIIHKLMNYTELKSN